MAPMNTVKLSTQIIESEYLPHSNKWRIKGNFEKTKDDLSKRKGEERIQSEL